MNYALLALIYIIAFCHGRIVGEGRLIIYVGDDKEKYDKAVCGILLRSK